DVVIGDAVRVLVANKGVPNAEFVQLLTAVYGDKELQRAQEDYGSYTGVEPYPIKQDAGNPVTKVTSIIDWSPTCVVALADRDYAHVFVNRPTGDDTRGVIELHPKRQARDPGQKNATAWELAGEGPA